MESTTANISFSSTTDAPVKIARGNTLPIIYFCIGSFGLVGNLLVLIVLGRYATLRKSRTNKLIMHQSSIDFLGAVFLILTTAIEHGIPGYTESCLLWFTKLPMWGIFATSTYNILLISVERYLGVIHTTWYKRTVSDRHFMFCMPIVWVIGFGYQLAYIIPIRIETGSDGSCRVYSSYPSPAARIVVGIATLSVLFLIPLMILFYCYITLIYTLWKKGKNVVSERDILLHHNRTNVIRTLVLVSFCFIVCWICNMVYVVLYHISHPVDLTSDFYHTTVIAAFCNCCINPIVYMLQYEQFQDGAKKLLCFCWKDNAVLDYDFAESRPTSISTVRQKRSLQSPTHSLPSAKQSHPSRKQSLQSSRQSFQSAILDNPLPRRNTRGSLTETY